MAAPQQVLTAYLSVSDGPAAVEFYRRAFGAQEVGERMTAPDGKILHTELSVGGERFYLADEFPEFGNLGPQRLGGTSIRLCLQVENADEIAQQAVEAGATLVYPVADQFYGERSGRVMDPFGHVWIISQHIEDVSPEEIQRRAKELFSQPGS